VNVDKFIKDIKSNIKYFYCCEKKGIQTDKNVDRRTDKYTDRQIDGQVYIHRDRQTCIQTDMYTTLEMERKVDRQTAEKIGIDGWKGIQTDG
jgi:hypothetical protein